MKRLREEGLGFLTIHPGPARTILDLARHHGSRRYDFFFRFAAAPLSLFGEPLALKSRRTLARRRNVTVARSLSLSHLEAPDFGRKSRRRGSKTGRGRGRRDALARSNGYYQGDALRRSRRRLRPLQ